MQPHDNHVVMPLINLCADVKSPCSTANDISPAPNVFCCTASSTISIDLLPVNLTVALIGTGHFDPSGGFAIAGSLCN
jgi:hypothetical protein